jgi:energy-coupling factor transporter ATP-binding protein EcfA2
VPLRDHPYEAGAPWESDVSGSSRSAVPEDFSPPSAAQLLDTIGGFLAIRGPKFLLIVGKVGAGKSTLLRALVPGVAGRKMFLAYHSPSAPDLAAAGAGGPIPSVRMLLVLPGRGAPEKTSGARDPGGSSSLAFSPQGSGGEAGETAPLDDATAQLIEGGAGSIVVDSWDRESDAYFRSQAETPDDVTVFRAPVTALVEMQSAIISNPVHLLLAVTPELAQPLLSMADGVVALHDEERPGGRLRVATVAKIRGPHQPLPDHLYTLEGGRFHAVPSLPTGFRPPIGPSDDDPEPGTASGWPGSAAFAGAFGRLRFGGLTGITLASECPDTVPHALAGPLAVHTLRAGGRVVWIPAPTIRPSQIVEYFRQHVPDDGIRDRLRILTASGDESSLGELRTVVLPLSREAPTETVPTSAIAPGVRMLFPELYRFYRERTEDTSAVLLGSFEGFRASAAAAGVTVDPATMPLVLGAYARLPKFHIFGYCDRSDPVVPHLRPGADTLVEIEMVHGRPVLFGLRPQTPPYLLDWPDASGRYALVPVN